jgi:ABC-type dipeptide/oligopeptide/nickel transport system permease component
MVDLVTLAGSSGLFMLLLAFILESIGKLSHESYIYHTLNFIGAFILAYYAITLGSMVFLFLEIAWGMFSLYKLFSRFVKDRKHYRH